MPGRIYKMEKAEGNQFLAKYHRQTRANHAVRLQKNERLSPFPWIIRVQFPETPS